MRNGIALDRWRRSLGCAVVLLAASCGKPTPMDEKISVYIDVYLPYFRSGKPRASVDDCLKKAEEDCTILDYNGSAAKLQAGPGPNPDGARNGVPASHINVINVKNPLLLHGTLAFKEQAFDYTAVREVLAVAGRLSQRVRSKMSCPSYDDLKKITVTVDLPATAIDSLAADGVLDCDVHRSCKHLGPPKVQCAQATGNSADQIVERIDHPLVEIEDDLAKADAVVAASELLYAKSSKSILDLK